MREAHRLIARGSEHVRRDRPGNPSCAIEYRPPFSRCRPVSPRPAAQPVSPRPASPLGRGAARSPSPSVFRPAGVARVDSAPRQPPSRPASPLSGDRPRSPQVRPVSPLREAAGRYARAAPTPRMASPLRQANDRPYAAVPAARPASPLSRPLVNQRPPSAQTPVARPRSPLPSVAPSQQRERELPPQLSPRGVEILQRREWLDPPAIDTQGARQVIREAMAIARPRSPMMRAL